MIASLAAEITWAPSGRSEDEPVQGPRRAEHGDSRQ